MFVILSGFLVPLGLAIGVLMLMELGRKVGFWRIRRGDEPTSGGAIEGAVFAIFGLLVAFTFSGAASRFDERRALIGQEANDVGTAWLRLDLLPVEHQAPLRNDFRQYLDARIAAYHSAGELEKTAALLKESDRLQAQIWSGAIAACRADASPATTTLVLTSLNAMFDMATTQLMASRIHPPNIIFILLVSLALVCAFLAGNAMVVARPNRLHAIGFSLVIAFTVYVILDMEYPRLGFIRIDAADQVLMDLRASMGPLTAL
jgi:hypothetical protein